ncbi:MAG: acyltransferase family protein [Prevotella sp.]|nr:acyltransferase family protein [Prevotella sp.]
MKNKLSLQQTQALRGLAILGIILHNYCHFLKFAVKENEYTFTAEKPRQLLEKLMSIDSDLFIHILSFFGHYGVPVFLFISGYGLVKKYEAPHSAPEGATNVSAHDGNVDPTHTAANVSAHDGNVAPTHTAANVSAHDGNVAPSGAEGGASSSSLSSSLSFLLRHFRKLFRLMIWGYLLFVAVYFLRHDDGATVYSWDRIAAQLTMTVNFLYEHPDRIIKPGPYWYFGLMMQIYALYIFVIHRWRSNWLLLALVAVCWMVQVIVPAPDVLNFVRYNFIGGMLPFAIGVALARYEGACRGYGGTGVRGCENSNLAPSHLRTSAPTDSNLAPRTSHLVPREINLVPREKHLAPTIIVSALAVFAGSFWFHSWLWVPLFIVVGAVATVWLMPQWLLKPCAWVGGISAALFVMHPLMREIIIPHYRHTDIYFGIAVYLLASVAAAMLLQWLTSKSKTKK